MLLALNRPIRLSAVYMPVINIKYPVWLAFFFYFHYFQGNAIQTLTAKDPIKVLTIRGTNFEAAPLEGGSASTENLSADGCATDLTVFSSQELSKSDRPELTSAKVVVSGGG